MRRIGRPTIPPEMKTKVVGLRMRAVLHDALFEAAIARGTTRNQIVSQLVEEFLKQTTKTA